MRNTRKSKFRYIIHLCQVSVTSFNIPEFGTHLPSQQLSWHWSVRPLLVVQSSFGRSHSWSTTAFSDEIPWKAACKCWRENRNHWNTCDKSVRLVTQPISTENSLYTVVYKYNSNQRNCTFRCWAVGDLKGRKKLCWLRNEHSSWPTCFFRAILLLERRETHEGKMAKVTLKRGRLATF